MCGVLRGTRFLSLLALLLGAERRNSGIHLKVHLWKVMRKKLFLAYVPSRPYSLHLASHSASRGAACTTCGPRPPKTKSGRALFACSTGVPKQGTKTHKQGMIGRLFPGGPRFYSLGSGC